MESPHSLYVELEIDHNGDTVKFTILKDLKRSRYGLYPWIAVKIWVAKLG